MAQFKEIQFEPRRELAAAAIGAIYGPIGSAFARPVRILKLVNTTNECLDVSFNGKGEHDVLPANSFVLYDLTSNKINSEGAFLKAGQVIYVRSTSGVVPTSGSVYEVVLSRA